MKMRSWSESSGAMLVPSTFTGWYKNTMMTSARPMAIKRSRVQTRISLRRECGDAGRSGGAIGDTAGAVVSGDAVVVTCFSSELSIFGCLVFIACPPRPAPDAICNASGRIRRKSRCCYFLFDSDKAVGRCLERRFWRLRFSAQRVVHRSQSGDDGGFRAKNQLAEGGLLEAAAAGGFEFGVGPAAFGPDGKSRVRLLLAFEDVANRGRVRSFREHHAQAILVRYECDLRLCEFGQNGDTDAARLLRSLEQDFFPAFGALRGCGEQRLIAARGCERNDCRHTEFSGLFDGPFEHVEFHDSEQEG